MKRHFGLRFLWAGLIVVPCGLVIALDVIAAEAMRKNLGDIGQFAKWEKIEVAMIGFESHGEGNPNPFGILVDVVFTSPGGKKHTFPGFYDGDGKGGPDGNLWKVRFSADETGRWSFVSKSADKRLDGYMGSITVAPPRNDSPDFYRWGRLEYVGTPANNIRYLKFRDGPYWLKAGCDDPENFLGNFRNYDTPGKRNAAIDYLAARGVNSMYMMTHNIDGDHQDVWPWLGKSAREAKANAGSDARFDIAKLEEWRRLFEYMQVKGVVSYLVLEDDSAWKGYDHARYYRELISRFGYLPALIFNFNEEHNENYRLSEALSFMRLLEDIDPYDHPRGVHNVNEPNDAYVDAPEVDFTSIQTGGNDPLQHNRMAIAWINRCKARNKRIPMVGFDEGRPVEDRRGWWSAYMGGGVWEVHVGQPYDQPMSAWEPAWTEIGGARAFMESLPFWEMEPNNDLVRSGTAFCLAKPGEAYALYLPNGGSVTVELAPGPAYEYAWWKATNGRKGEFQNKGRVRGGRQRFTAPGKGDWALRIVQTGP
jgi:hypothetical protein